MLVLLLFGLIAATVLGAGEGAGTPRWFEPDGVYRLGFPLSEEQPALRLVVKHYADDFDPAVEPDWPAGAGPIRVTAARGEREPACFVMIAARDLTDVAVEVSGVPAVVRRVVRAPLRRINTGPPKDYEIVGRFLPRYVPRDLPAAAFCEIWLDLQVPLDAKPGAMPGRVTVTADGGVKAELPLVLEVLPFTLPPDPDKRMGVYYRGVRRLTEPDRLRAELRDMREHGVTDLVVDAWIDSDREGDRVRAEATTLAALLARIEEAGFTDTIVVGDGLDRLERLMPGALAQKAGYPALWGRIVNGIYLRASPFSLSTPWIYQSYGGNPYDDTDHERHDFGLAFPAPGDPLELVPTRIYQCLAEGQDDCRYFHLLETLARERRARRPATAAAALEFLSQVEGFITSLKIKDGKTGTQGEAPLVTALALRFDGAALDELRRETVKRILALTESRTIGFRVTGPDTNPWPYVLATMAGENGTPVRGLYDTRIELDAEGRGKIEGVPPGVYSLRLHTLREFRSEADYDLVSLHRIDLTEDHAGFHSRLRPGGRISVTLNSPARLVVYDEHHHLVATTFWRGEQGGWSTDVLRLTPAFTSCVLPPGSYRVEAIRYRQVIAGGSATVKPGGIAALHLSPPR